MGCSWAAHGVSVGCLSGVGRVSLGQPYDVRIFSVEFPWGTHVMSVIRLWRSIGCRGVSVACRCRIHGEFTCSPWVFRGVSVGRQKGTRRSRVVSPVEFHAMAEHEIPMKCTKQHKCPTFVKCPNCCTRAPPGRLTDTPRTPNGLHTNTPPKPSALVSWLPQGKIMGCPQTTYGRPTTDPWAGYGQPTDTVRVTHGQPMCTPCVPHGGSMGHSRGVRVVSMGSPWVGDGVSVGCPWRVGGVPVGYPSGTHGISVGFPWRAGGVSMRCRSAPMGCPWDIRSVFVRR